MISSCTVDNLGDAQYLYLARLSYSSYEIITLSTVRTVLELTTLIYLPAVTELEA